MTYCVAMRLDEGLLFASDSRTNAGVDHIATFRKMTVFELPGERLIVLLNSGNLATTQSVISLLRQRLHGEGTHLMNVPTLYDAAELVGRTIKEVLARDAEPTVGQGVDFGGHFLVGGQIQGEHCRLFHVYAEGNFIEASKDTPYFQIGESKYGKPIIDRVVKRHTSLDEAAKLALISMDSTIRSNLSVGVPLDLAIIKTDELQISSHLSIDAKNEYFAMIRNRWSEALGHAFDELPNPDWLGRGDELP